MRTPAPIAAAQEDEDPILKYLVDPSESDMPVIAEEAEME